LYKNTLLARTLRKKSAKQIQIGSAACRGGNWEKKRKLLYNEADFYLILSNLYCRPYYRIDTNRCYGEGKKKNDFNFDGKSQKTTISTTLESDIIH